MSQRLFLLRTWLNSRAAARCYPPDGRWLLALLLGLCCLAPVQAQNFMRPRLDALNPPGVKAGTSVEVVLTGADLDEVKELFVSDGRIKAEFVPPPPPDPKAKPKPNTPPPPPKFKITVPAEVSLGLYDIRAIGKWGISNPRALTVGDLNEVQEKEANNDVPEAQKVELNSTINGVISAPTDVDYYVFTAKKGQKVVVRCAASNIDSKMNPLLEVYTKGGRELGNNRNYFDRNANVRFTAPADDEYYVRVCSFAYLEGGNDAFYRLSISETPWIDAVYPPVVQAGKSTQVTLYGTNLPGGQVDPGSSIQGQPVEKLAVTINPPPAPLAEGKLDYSELQLPNRGSMIGFEYRVKNGAGSSNPALLTYSELPVVLDNEANDAEDKAQRLTLPATLCGRIEAPGDRDYYIFTAKAGETFHFEGFADRLGTPINLYFMIKKVDSKQVLATVDTHSEIPDTINRFPLYTADPKGRFVAPADGDYLLMVSTYTNFTRYGPRFVYRVNLHKETPDFRVVVVSNDSEHFGGFTILKGGAQDLNVVVFREDGFDGEVLLEAEGLPGGVTCVPQVVGPKLKQGALVLQAADGAAATAVTFKVKATANINGKPTVRYARPASLVWSSQNNIPAISRLTRALCLAVRDKGPFTLNTSVKEMVIPLGGNVEYKVTAQRHWKEMNNQQIQLTRVASPAQSNGQFINTPNVNIAGNQNEAVVKFQIPTNAPAGTYNLVLQGKAQFQYQPDPKNNQKKNVQFYEPTPPVKVTVYDQVAEVAVNTPKVSLKPGTETDLVVTVKRLHDYKGEFTVQVAVPNGFQGLSVANGKIAANQNEVKIKLKADKNAKPQMNPNFIIKASARVGNATFTQEAKFEVTVTADKAARLPRPVPLVRPEQRLSARRFESGERAPVTVVVAAVRRGQ